MRNEALLAGCVVAVAAAAWWGGQADDTAIERAPDHEASSSVAADAAPLVPHGTSTAAAAAGEDVRGTVQEVIDVERYRYLRLRTAAAADTWVAVPKGGAIETGAEVRVADAVAMRDFHSKTLGRTFEVIHFGVLAPAGARGAQLPAGHPVTGTVSATAAGSSPAAAPQVGEILPLEGGLTIETVFARAASLEGKPVRIAARVVKVTPKVLGRTWLHLQDGSGSADDGTHDLVVTTTAEPAVGDEVVVTGTLKRDTDIGSGYRFAVLIADAELSQRGKPD
jgi:hypothetical protein